jgi:hypothetical protein
MKRLTLLLVACASSAQAHHEAIFGPQSSLVLSAPGFLSLQAFSRRTVRGLQETTGLISAGGQPFRGVPLSFTAILPATYSNAPRLSAEDAILGARYRLGFGGSDGNFALAMAALEVPTGNTDHEALHGPFNALGALLGSLESGAFSGIGYGFVKQNGPRGTDLFAGGGFAWTPFDDPSTERLLSFQLGVSLERRLPKNGTDGVSRLVVHPTIVWGPGAHLLVFAVVSVPALQRGNPNEQDSYRAGGGIVWLFGS